METLTHVPLIVERTYDAPVHQVWQALTDREKMKHWYFDIPGFKAELGAEFTFKAGCDGDQEFLHSCKITALVPNQKIAYTWHYPGYDGMSEVSFELSGDNGKTHLKLTHSGLETFPQTGAFARENFNGGWTHFAGALGDFLRK
jgi:uncharacterized protein YndB with AHSA1/START domain